VVIRLELDLAEVNGILKVLNELPTSSGAWPLVKKIEEQAAPQVEEPGAQE
jgi:hypothetical protein